MSICVQALPSLQGVPSMARRCVQVPINGLQASTSWHESLGVQTKGFPPMHAPLWQVSVCVQRSPSVQPVPSALATATEHVPVEMLQTPAWWHWSGAVQTTGFAPVHAPAWQVSVCVHALPSLHVVPFAAAGFEHTPLVVSHAPATWHWSLAVHTIGFAPVHAPVWHVSAWVHAFPSLQVVPLAAAGFEHTPVAGAHVPATWH